MKLLLRLVGLVVALVVLALVAAFVYLDVAAKAAIERGGTNALGVETTVDTADVKVLAGRFEMRGLLRSGSVDLGPIVTHRFRLDDFDRAFELMASGECGKVVMFPDPADADGPLM